MNTSVVSAAIIEGNLIIGLSDGSIINCGFVQGPQGLTGLEGPMGSSGDRGTDGNTIITVAGTPGNDIGSDGDYAIDNINWRIYGPKSGGVWGKAKEMLPGPENILENGRSPSGGSGGGSMGGSGSGGGGSAQGTIFTNTVQLTNSTRTSLTSTGEYSIIPQPPSGLTNQEDLNQWGYGTAFGYIDAAIPVATGTTEPKPLPGATHNWDRRLWPATRPDVPALLIYDATTLLWVQVSPSALLKIVQLQNTPPDPAKDGDLWFDTDPAVLTLFVYSEDSTAWIPAAPPTSLESRVSAGETLQADILARLTANEGLTTNHAGQIDTLENKVEALEGNNLSGQWALALTGSPRPGRVLLYKEDFSDGVTNWNDVKYLGFSKEDAGGVTHEFDDVIIDEFIRFTTNVGEANACTFKVVENTWGATGLFGVTVNVQKGTPVDLESYRVEFLPPFDPTQYATVTYVDDQDDTKLNLTGGILTGELTVNVGGDSNKSAFKITNADNNKAGLQIWSPGGASSETKYVGQNGTDHWFQVYDDTNKNPVTTAIFGHQNYSFTAESNITYSAATQHTFTGSIAFTDGTFTFKRGGKTSSQFKISPNGGETDYATNIYSLNDGQMRFRTSHNDNESGHVGSHIVLSANGGTPRTQIYHVVEPTDASMAASKAYVDSQVGNANGVPIGTVVMWFGDDAPTGWLKCDGTDFSTTTYAALHTHLQTVSNYVSGKTPNFQGLYPGGAGISNNNQLISGGENKGNVFFSQRTSRPHGGAPKSSASIPDGSIRDFNKTGGTKAYSDGISKVTIDEGWDNVTRPPTLSIHFIIRAA